MGGREGMAEGEGPSGNVKCTCKGRTYDPSFLLPI